MKNNLKYGIAILILLSFVGIAGIIASCFSYQYFLSTPYLWSWYFMLILSILIIIFPVGIVINEKHAGE